MAYTITLTDPETSTTYDISNRTMGITIEESLDSDITKFKLVCKDIELEHLFHSIEVDKDGTLLISGIIIGQKDSDGGILSHKVTEFECQNWGYLLTKRIVAETYDTQTASDIIKDLFSTYATEFTTTNVDTIATTISEMQFQYITLKDAIEDVFKLLDADYHWYIDKNKDVHVFYQFESTGTTFDTSNISIGSLSVEYTGQRHVNRVWIIGRKQSATASIDVYFTADGKQRYFTLPYEPNDSNIYLDTGSGYVLKNSKLEQNDDGLQDFLINKEKKVFFIPSNVSPPFTGTIKYVMKPTIQFIDLFENYSDIKVNGALEKAVKNTQITDKLEARRFGKAEIKKTSSTRRKVSFSSRQTGIALGQKCAVDIQYTSGATTLWNIQGNFLVTAITTKITPADITQDFKLEELI